MKIKIVFCIPFMVHALLAAGQQPVKVWNEPLAIPTYEVRPADVNPVFFKGDVYQGASKVIYPYALMDNLGNLPAQQRFCSLSRQKLIYPLACISVIQHDPVRAPEQVEQCLQTNQANDQALPLKASILLNMGKADEALDLLDAAWHKDPLNWRVGYERIMCLWSLQKPAEAKQRQQKWLKGCADLTGHGWNWPANYRRCVTSKAKAYCALS